MKIVIIGAGNVGAVFGRLIREAGHEVLQVCSRTMEHAAELAKELGCEAVSGTNALAQTADMYLATVSDAALLTLYQYEFPAGAFLVHTAGAVEKDVLKEISPNYGVLYPLQTLRKEDTQLRREIPLLVDACCGEALETLAAFAGTLSSKVVRVNDEERLKMHVAAVFVSNFTNHLYALAHEYCEKEGLDFKMLLPIIEETALRVREHLPQAVQTGPAFRKDIPTLNKHLGILTAHPVLRKVYLRMTDSIMNPSHDL